MSDLSNPIVSIIIPTLNRYDLLQQTLDSVQRQTFKEWEALVIDDGSNDDTEEKVVKMSQDDLRIRYRKRSSQKSGACVCRNEGTEASSGEYIIYLDSDDCLSPVALKNRMWEMERHPDLDFGIFPCILFDNHPGDIKLLWNIDTDINDIDRFLALDVPWQTTSPIWRRSSVLKLGSWNENLPSWQDWEYHLRALIKNLRYKKFSEPDCFWRTPYTKRKSIWSLPTRKKKKSIGRKSHSPEHLYSQELLFIEIQQMLSNSGLFTDNRRILLGGLYFYLAQDWLKFGKKAEALRVWNLCYEKKLIEQNFYLQGNWYLKSVVPMPWIRRLVRKYLETVWPQELLLSHGQSKTYHKIPVLDVGNFSD